VRTQKESSCLLRKSLKWDTLAFTSTQKCSKMTEAEKISSNGKPKDGLAFTDKDRRDIYLNTYTTNFTSPMMLMGVLGHEIIHSAGNSSEVMGDLGYLQAQNAWMSENGYNQNTMGGGYDNNVQFYNANKKAAAIINGLEYAIAVQNIDPLQIVVRTDSKTQEGTLTLQSEDGKNLGTWPVLTKGEKGKGPTQTNGDTPEGTYSINWDRIQGGKKDTPARSGSNAAAYGTGYIGLIPNPGTAEGRDGLAIHGGGTSKTLVPYPYADSQKHFWRK
jgi:hypothetical protein